MTIKPFAIQGSDLTLGGVNIQAGATSIVIPGVTQATTYIVKELRRLNNPEFSDGNLDWPQEYPPVVIDGAYIAAASGDLFPIPNDFIPAQYQVTVENNGDIQIEIVNPGSGYTGAVAEFAATVPMRINAYGTQLPDFDPNTPEPGGWTIIDWVVNSGVGEVENIGGGGGGVDGLGKFKIENNYIGTVDNPDTGSWGGYNMYLDPHGEGNSGIIIPNNTNTADGTPLSLYNNGDGGIQLQTNRGVLQIGPAGEIGAPTHFHVALQGSNAAVPNTDLFFGDDFNFLRIGAYAQGVAIGTNDRDVGPQQTWTFNTAGVLTVPEYDGNQLFIQGGEIASAFEGSAVALSGHGAPVVINTYNPLPNTWAFGADGTTTFPDNKLKTSIDSNLSIVTEYLPTDPPTTIVISGADFVAVNLTYTQSISDPNAWLPAGYNPATDPYIQFADGQYGIHVPGFGQALYVNTGTLNVPLAQWNTNPPLGSVAPTGVYTYPNTYTRNWTFGTDGNLTLSSGGAVRSRTIDQVGSSLVIEAGSAYGDTAVSIASDPTLATTYPAGSTITFQDGDIRTITGYDDYPGGTDIFWDTSKTGTLFPITLKTSDYVPEIVPPVEIKLGSKTWSFTNNALGTNDESVLVAPAGDAQHTGAIYFPGTGMLGASGGIVGWVGDVPMVPFANSLTLDSSADVSIVAQYNVWKFGSNGMLTLPTPPDIPSTARGSAGDKAGMIFVYGNYFYHCYADYTDGSAAIWQRVQMDNSDW